MVIAAIFSHGAITHPERYIERYIGKLTDAGNRTGVAFAMPCEFG